MNKYISVMCLEYFNAVPFHATRYSLNVSTWKRDPVWSIAFRRKSTSRLAFLTVSDGCWLYIYFLFADPIDSHTRLQYSLCTLRRKSVYHSESISCRRFDDLSVKRIIGEYSAVSASLMSSIRIHRRSPYVTFPGNRNKNVIWNIQTGYDSYTTGTQYDLLGNFQKDKI